MNTPLPVALPAARSVTDVSAVRWAALWGILGAKLLAVWGLGWDIRWHLLIGRDSFWIAPHAMIYSGVAATALIAFGVLASETARARRGEPVPGTVSVAGLVGTPGFHLAGAGMVVTMLAAPIDDLWHRLFGLDVTLWSPPHLLGLAGAQLNTIACLAIAATLGAPAGTARRAALLLAGVLLLGGFETVTDPALRLAFLHGGLWFFLWSTLGALVFAFALVLGSRLDGSRGAPFALAAGAVLLQFTTVGVGDLGFALVQPESVIGQAIAADPESPIAVAHEMARRAGAPQPGRSLALRLLPVLPAAVLALVDARRRWAGASMAFGVALLAVSSVHFLRSPALAHVRPAPADFILAALAVAAAALAGGAAAVRLAAAITRRRAP